MDDQGNDRPPCQRDQADVGSPEQQRHEQDDHIGVAPRGDQAELAVEALPDMDVHAEILEEHALDQPLQHIACDHRRHHQREGLGRQRQPPIGQPGPPEIPPEGRVDQIDAMVDHIAPFGRCDGATGKLAVHRV